MSYKLKGKSSAKKRFRFTKGGKGAKVIRFAAKRRHNLGNRSKSLLKQSRGAIVCKPEVRKIIMKYTLRKKG